MINDMTLASEDNLGKETHKVFKVQTHLDVENTPHVEAHHGQIVTSCVELRHCTANSLKV